MDMNVTNLHPEHDQAGLLDALIAHLNLKNDAALARALDALPPVISKVRHNKLPVGASLLIRMHEVTGVSLRDLRGMMGDHGERFNSFGRAQKAAEA